MATIATTTDLDDKVNDKVNATVDAKVDEFVNDKISGLRGGILATAVVTGVAQLKDLGYKTRSFIAAAAAIVFALFMMTVPALPCGLIAMRDGSTLAKAGVSLSCLPVPLVSQVGNILCYVAYNRKS